jgi:hypothetical protein
MQTNVSRACGASAMAPESPNLTPESSEICHVEHDALLDDATKARTRAAMAVRRVTRMQRVPARIFCSFVRLQQRRSTSASPNGLIMTQAQLPTACQGEPRLWCRHGLEMQAARATATMPYAGLGRVQSKLFPVRRRGTHWTAIVGYPATLYSCMSGLTGALAGL